MLKAVDAVRVEVISENGQFACKLVPVTGLVFVSDLLADALRQASAALLRVADVLSPPTSSR